MMKKAVMYLTSEKWPALSTYLFIDIKLDGSKNNILGTKSRYKRLADYFSQTPFTRTNLNLYLSEMKENVLLNIFLN